MSEPNPQKALISFIPFGWGGAGDHLAQLRDELDLEYVLVPKSFFRNKKISKIFIAVQCVLIIFRIFFLLRFRNLEVTINHPQTLGYRLTSMILRLSSQVNYHVVDTHFFCIKSYNLYKGTACLNCLNGKEKYDSCNHFPIKQSDQSYRLFQSVIEQNLGKIIFYCQTSLYKDYLLKRYGEAADVQIKLMHTRELKRIALRSRSPQNKINVANLEKKFDIGYHAAFIPAKGSTYFLDLADTVPDLKLFVPEKGISIQKNVSFIPCTWNTGLIDQLLGCSIVMCPSIWTAPVEGAVLKSMLLRLPVALLPSNTFFDELPRDGFIPLTGQVIHDSVLILDLLKEPRKLQHIASNGFEFAKSYLI